MRSGHNNGPLFASSAPAPVDRLISTPRLIASLIDSKPEMGKNNNSQLSQGKMGLGNEFRWDANHLTEFRDLRRGKQYIFKQRSQTLELFQGKSKISSQSRKSQSHSQMMPLPGDVNEMSQEDDVGCTTTAKAPQHMYAVSLQGRNRSFGPHPRVKVSDSPVQSKHRAIDDRWESEETRLVPDKDTLTCRQREYRGKSKEFEGGYCLNTRNEEYHQKGKYYRSRSKKDSVKTIFLRCSTQSKLCRQTVRVEKIQVVNLLNTNRQVYSAQGKSRQSEYTLNALDSKDSEAGAIPATWPIQPGSIKYDGDCSGCREALQHAPSSDSDWKNDFGDRIFSPALVRKLVVKKDQMYRHGQAILADQGESNEEEKPLRGTDSTSSNRSVFIQCSNDTMAAKSCHDESHMDEHEEFRSLALENPESACGAWAHPPDEETSIQRIISPLDYSYTLSSNRISPGQKDSEHIPLDASPNVDDYVKDVQGQPATVVPQLPEELINEYKKTAIEILLQRKRDSEKKLLEESQKLERNCSPSNSRSGGTVVGKRSVSKAPKMLSAKGCIQGKSSASVNGKQVDTSPEVKKASKGNIKNKNQINSKQLSSKESLTKSPEDGRKRPSLQTWKQSISPIITRYQAAREKKQAQKIEGWLKSDQMSQSSDSFTTKGKFNPQPSVSIPSSNMANALSEVNRRSSQSDMCTDEYHGQNLEGSSQLMGNSTEKRSHIDFLQDILKSPSAKALQALTKFYEGAETSNSEANRVLPQDVDITVTDILKKYNALFNGNKDLPSASSASIVSNGTNSMCFNSRSSISKSYHESLVGFGERTKEDVNLTSVERHDLLTPDPSHIDNESDDLTSVVSSALMRQLITDTTRAVANGSATDISRGQTQQRKSQRRKELENVNMTNLLTQNMTMDSRISIGIDTPTASVSSLKNEDTTCTAKFNLRGQEKSLRGKEQQILNAYYRMQNLEINSPFENTEKGHQAFRPPKPSSHSYQAVVQKHQNQADGQHELAEKYHTDVEELFLNSYQDGNGQKIQTFRTTAVPSTHGYHGMTRGETQNDASSMWKRNNAHKNTVDKENHDCQQGFEFINENSPLLQKSSIKSNGNKVAKGMVSSGDERHSIKLQTRDRLPGKLYVTSSDLHSIKDVISRESLLDRMPNSRYSLTSRPLKINGDHVSDMPNKRLQFDTTEMLDEQGLMPNLSDDETMQDIHTKCQPYGLLKMEEIKHKLYESIRDKVMGKHSDTCRPREPMKGVSYKPVALSGDLDRMSFGQGHFKSPFEDVFSSKPTNTQTKDIHSSVSAERYDLAQETSFTKRKGKYTAKQESFSSDLNSKARARFKTTLNAYLKLRKPFSKKDITESQFNQEHPFPYQQSKRGGPLVSITKSHSASEIYNKGNPALICRGLDTKYPIANVGHRPQNSSSQPNTVLSNNVSAYSMIAEKSEGTFDDNNILIKESPGNSDDETDTFSTCLRTNTVRKTCLMLLEERRNRMREALENVPGTPSESWLTESEAICDTSHEDSVKESRKSMPPDGGRFNVNTDSDSNSALKRRNIPNVMGSSQRKLESINLQPDLEKESLSIIGSTAHLQNFESQHGNESYANKTPEEPVKVGNMSQDNALYDPIEIGSIASMQVEDDGKKSHEVTRLIGVSTSGNRTENTFKALTRMVASRFPDESSMDSFLHELFSRADSDLDVKYRLLHGLTSFIIRNVFTGHTVPVLPRFSFLNETVIGDNNSFAIENLQNPGPAFASGKTNGNGDHDDNIADNPFLTKDVRENASRAEEISEHTTVDIGANTKLHVSGDTYPCDSDGTRSTASNASAKSNANDVAKLSLAVKELDQNQFDKIARELASDIERAFRIDDIHGNDFSQSLLDLSAIRISGMSEPFSLWTKRVCKVQTRSHDPPMYFRSPQLRSSSSDNLKLEEGLDDMSYQNFLGHEYGNAATRGQMLTALLEHYQSILFILFRMNACNIHRGCSSHYWQDEIMDALYQAEAMRNNIFSWNDDFEEISPDIAADDDGIEHSNNSDSENDYDEDEKYDKTFEINVLANASDVSCGVHSSLSEDLLNQTIVHSNEQVDQTTVNLYEQVDQTTANLYKQVDQTTANLYKQVDQTTANLYEQFDRTTANLYEQVDQTTANLYERVDQTTANLYEQFDPTTVNSYEQVDQTTVNSYEQVDQTTVNSYEQADQTRVNSYEKVDQTTENSYGQVKKDTPGDKRISWILPNEEKEEFCNITSNVPSLDDTQDIPELNESMLERNVMSLQGISILDKSAIPLQETPKPDKPAMSLQETLMPDKSISSVTARHLCEDTYLLNTCNESNVTQYSVENMDESKEASDDLDTVDTVYGSDSVGKPDNNSQWQHSMNDENPVMFNLPSEKDSCSILNSDVTFTVPRLNHSNESMSIGNFLSGKEYEKSIATALTHLKAGEIATNSLSEEVNTGPTDTPIKGCLSPSLLNRPLLRHCADGTYSYPDLSSCNDQTEFNTSNIDYHKCDDQGQKAGKKTPTDQGFEKTAVQIRSLRERSSKDERSHTRQSFTGILSSRLAEVNTRKTPFISPGEARCLWREYLGETFSASDIINSESSGQFSDADYSINQTDIIVNGTEQSIKDAYRPALVEKGNEISETTHTLATPCHLREMTQEDSYCSSKDQCTTTIHDSSKPLEDLYSLNPSHRDSDDLDPHTYQCSLPPGVKCFRKERLKSYPPRKSQKLVRESDDNYIPENMLGKCSQDGIDNRKILKGKMSSDIASKCLEEKSNNTGEKLWGSNISGFSEKLEESFHLKNEYEVSHDYDRGQSESVQSTFSSPTRKYQKSPTRVRHATRTEMNWNPKQEAARLTFFEKIGAKVSDPNKEHAFDQGKDVKHNSISSDKDCCFTSLSHDPRSSPANEVLPDENHMTSTERVRLNKCTFHFHPLAGVCDQPSNKKVTFLNSHDDCLTYSKIDGYFVRSAPYDDVASMIKKKDNIQAHFHEDEILIETNLTIDTNKNDREQHDNEEPETSHRKIHLQNESKRRPNPNEKICSMCKRDRERNVCRNCTNQHNTDEPFKRNSHEDTYQEEKFDTCSDTIKDIGSIATEVLTNCNSELPLGFTNYLTSPCVKTRHKNLNDHLLSVSQKEESKSKGIETILVSWLVAALETVVKKRTERKRTRGRPRFSRRRLRNASPSEKYSSRKRSHVGFRNGRQMRMTHVQVSRTTGHGYKTNALAKISPLPSDFHSAGNLSDEAKDEVVEQSSENTFDDLKFIDTISNTDLERKLDNCDLTIPCSLENVDEDGSNVDELPCNDIERSRRSKSDECDNNGDEVFSEQVCGSINNKPISCTTSSVSIYHSSCSIDGRLSNSVPYCFSKYIAKKSESNQDLSEDVQNCANNVSLHGHTEVFPRIDIDDYNFPHATTLNSDVKHGLTIERSSSEPILSHKAYPLLNSMISASQLRSSTSHPTMPTVIKSETMSENYWLDLKNKNSVLNDGNRNCLTLCVPSHLKIADDDDKAMVTNASKIRHSMYGTQKQEDETPLNSTGANASNEGKHQSMEERNIGKVDAQENRSSCTLNSNAECSGGDNYSDSCIDLNEIDSKYSSISQHSLQVANDTYTSMSLTTLNTESKLKKDGVEELVKATPDLSTKPLGHNVCTISSGTEVNNVICSLQMDNQHLSELYIVTEEFSSPGQVKHELVAQAKVGCQREQENYELLPLHAKELPSLEIMLESGISKDFFENSKSSQKPPVIVQGCDAGDDISYPLSQKDVKHRHKKYNMLQKINEMESDKRPIPLEPNRPGIKECKVLQEGESTGEVIDKDPMLENHNVSGISEYQIMEDNKEKAITKKSISEDNDPREVRKYQIIEDSKEEVIDKKDTLENYNTHGVRMYQIMEGIKKEATDKVSILKDNDNHEVKKYQIMEDINEEATDKVSILKDNDNHEVKKYQIMEDVNEEATDKVSILKDNDTHKFKKYHIMEDNKGEAIDKYRNPTCAIAKNDDNETTDVEPRLWEHDYQQWHVTSMVNESSTHLVHEAESSSLTLDDLLQLPANYDKVIHIKSKDVGDEVNGFHEQQQVLLDPSEYANERIVEPLLQGQTMHLPTQQQCEDRIMQDVNCKIEEHKMCSTGEESGMQTLPMLEIRVNEPMFGKGTDAKKMQESTPNSVSGEDVCHDWNTEQNSNAQATSEKSNAQLMQQIRGHQDATVPDGETPCPSEDVGEMPIVQRDIASPKCSEQLVLSGCLVQPVMEGGNSESLSRWEGSKQPNVLSQDNIIFCPENTNGKYKLNTCPVADRNDPLVIHEIEQAAMKPSRSCHHVGQSEQDALPKCKDGEGIGLKWTPTCRTDQCRSQDKTVTPFEVETSTPQNEALGTPTVALLHQRGASQSSTQNANKTEDVITTTKEALPSQDPDDNLHVLLNCDQKSVVDRRLFPRIKTKTPVSKTAYERLFPHIESHKPSLIHEPCLQKCLPILDERETKSKGCNFEERPYHFDSPNMLKYLADSNVCADNTSLMKENKKFERGNNCNQENNKQCSKLEMILSAQRTNLQRNALSAKDAKPACFKSNPRCFRNNLAFTEGLRLRKNKLSAHRQRIGFQYRFDPVYTHALYTRETFKYGNSQRHPSVGQSNVELPMPERANLSIDMTLQDMRVKSRIKKHLDQSCVIPRRKPSRLDNVCLRNPAHCSLLSVNSKSTSDSLHSHCAGLHAKPVTGDMCGKSFLDQDDMVKHIRDPEDITLVQRNEYRFKGDRGHRSRHESRSRETRGAEVRTESYWTVLSSSDQTGNLDEETNHHSMLLANGFYDDNNFACNPNDRAPVKHKFAEWCSYDDDTSSDDQIKAIDAIQGRSSRFAAFDDKTPLFHADRIKKDRSPQAPHMGYYDGDITRLAPARSVTNTSGQFLHEFHRTRANATCGASNSFPALGRRHIQSDPYPPQAAEGAQIEVGSANDVVNKVLASKDRPAKLAIDIYQLPSRCRPGQVKGKAMGRDESNTRRLAISGPLMNVSVPVYHHDNHSDKQTDEGRQPPFNHGNGSNNTAGAWSKGFGTPEKMRSTKGHELDQKGQRTRNRDKPHTITTRSTNHSDHSHHQYESISSAPQRVSSLKETSNSSHPSSQSSSRWENSSHGFHRLKNKVKKVLGFRK